MVKWDELPSGAGHLARTFPEVWNAYATLGEACAEAGPLDERTRRLVKLALAIGVASEGAIHSHARRALEDGITPEELLHVVLLAIPATGLPNAVKALTWPSRHGKAGGMNRRSPVGTTGSRARAEASAPRKAHSACRARRQS